MSASMLVRPKVAGIGAIGFAACVLTINIIENVATGRPDPGVDPAEVVAWAAGAQAHLWANMILIPISGLLLLAFVAGIISILRRAGGDETPAIVGGIGFAMIFGTLSTAFAADAVVISRADTLSLELVGALTDITLVLFILNWSSIALTLWALSRASWAAGLIPRWLERLTLAGAAMLALGSTQGVLALRGTLPPLLIGLGGFLIWLLFLIVVGIRTIRFDPGAAVGQRR
jgi:hypothetical protein